MKRSHEDGARPRPKRIATAERRKSSPTDQLAKLAGKKVDPHVRRTGDYLIGPRLGVSPVKSILHCLGRRDGTDRYFLLKILHLGIGSKETQDERQGKMLLHTENSLLSLLEGESGVIQKHATFVDTAPQEEEAGAENQLVYTGRRVRRIVLVLDCVAPHNFSTQTQNLVNLQHHVIREKKLSERETLVIFHNVVKIVESLHKKDIVHRDLKLGNIVLDRRSQAVTITNFCLGKHLMREDDLLKDQRGSPAYISPDVLSGKPYKGKPSDMWALGVVLYTMLYGQFPFYDNVPQELFNKIKAADFTVPDDGRVSEDARNLIRRLLVTDPDSRLTSTQVRVKVEGIILMWRNISPAPDDFQIVPEMESPEKESSRKKKTEFSQDSLLLNLGSQGGEFLSEPAAEVSKPRRDGKNGVIPVHKLGEDARPLSAEEYRMYSQAITQMRGGRVRSNRQTAANDQVLVRSDRLPGFQRQLNRPNLAAPTTTASLPATVPDQAEVLDLSQGPRREEAPVRSTVPPYIGQGMPAPSQTRPGVVRTSSALSLVGALRRLGTRVNLVPVSTEVGATSSRNRAEAGATSSRNRDEVGATSSRSRAEAGPNSSRTRPSGSRRSSSHRHTSRHSDSGRRSRRPPRDPDNPSIVPSPSLPIQAPDTLPSLLSLPPGESIALPLAEATRLLGLTLGPIRGQRRDQEIGDHEQQNLEGAEETSLGEAQSLTEQDL